MKKDNQLEKVINAISNEIDVFGEMMDVSKFKELQKQLEKYLTRDALTLALNRWKFEEVLEREMERAKVEKTALSLFMLDIDKFKQINDGLGHNEGDDILKEVAWDVEFNIEGTIGKSHRFGRWGGDEFLYIFPSKNVTETKVIAEKTRNHIDGLYMDNKLSRPITVSVGVAQLKKSDDSKAFIDRADKAMYKSKEKGGNRVEVSR